VVYLLQINKRWSIPVIVIKAVEHLDPEIAAAIHAVQMAAYTQEAALLEVRNFPPLERTVRDIQISNELYLAAIDDAALIGVVSIGLDEELEAQNIVSLVVSPERQREGIASRLMKALLEQYGYGSITVQTAVKNLPVLALYARFGFVEIKRWTVGVEHLELVRLHRPGTSNK
jgi:ribosomal protein S18 acetylase RimI-like enzyme